MENQRIYGIARMWGYPLRRNSLMLLQTNDTVVKLDKEWVELILIAIKMDITLEEIRDFLSGRSVFIFDEDE